jgi:hypothetical protein
LNFCLDDFHLKLKKKYLVYGDGFVFLFDTHVKIISIFIFFPYFFLDLRVHLNVKGRIVDTVTDFLFGVLAVDMERLIFARF